MRRGEKEGKQVRKRIEGKEVKREAEEGKEVRRVGERGKK